MADEAHNAGSEQRIALAAAGSQQGNMEVVVHIDGKEEASFSPPNTALLVGTPRRRHALPKKQISLGRNNQGNNDSFGVFIDDTNGKIIKEEEEEAAPLPKETSALAGIQLLGDVVVELPVPVADVAPEAQPPIAGFQDEASPPPREEEFEAAAADGATTGLPEQALMTIIGKYIERVGQIIALIGLGTITSTLGGLFTRDLPNFFVQFLIDGQDDNAPTTRGDERDALILYYKCLPAFFVVGLLEMCYGIWVSRNQPLRAGKRAKTILILSAVLLIVTVCFTGAGVSV